MGSCTHLTKLPVPNFKRGTTPAKVEHLLGLTDAADVRTGQTAAPHDEAKCRDRHGLLGSADKRDVPVVAEQVDVGVDVVGGDGVKDEVEAASGQVPSESTMQPTTERSPGLYLVTAEPTLVTRADDFMAGHIGVCCP